MRDEMTAAEQVAGTGVAGEGAVAVEQRPAAPGDGTDPRMVTLRQAVARLRRELATHPADLSDRAVAEGELDVLDAMAGAGMPEPARLRHCLLLVAAAVGSVSALGPALGEVRRAVELFSASPEG